MKLVHNEQSTLKPFNSDFPSKKEPDQLKYRAPKFLPVHQIGNFKIPSRRKILLRMIEFEITDEVITQQDKLFLCIKQNYLL